VRTPLQSNSQFWTPHDFGGCRINDLTHELLTKWDVTADLVGEGCWKASRPCSLLAIHAVYPGIACVARMPRLAGVAAGTIGTRGTCKQPDNNEGL